MTSEDARAILATRFTTQWEALLAAYNYFIDGVSEPDFSTQTDPFGFLSVKLPSNHQSGLNGDTPPLRYEGQIHIGLFVKKGEGTKPFFLMSDAVTTMFASQVLSGIRLTEINIHERTPAIGWQSKTLIVDYNFDS